MNIIPVEKYQYNTKLSFDESIRQLKELSEFKVSENKFFSSQRIGLNRFAFIIGFINNSGGKTIIDVKIKMNFVVLVFLYIILAFCSLGLIISIIQSVIRQQIMWEGILGTIGFAIIAYLFYLSLYIMDASRKLAHLKKVLLIS